MVTTRGIPYTVVALLVFDPHPSLSDANLRANCYGYNRRTLPIRDYTWCFDIAVTRQ